MDEDRSSKEGFGEADLAEAQAENPPADPEMLDREAEETEDTEAAAEDVPAAPPADPTPADQAGLAAQRAARIGGPRPQAEGAPEEQPVVEAGGGESEGFEEAERELEEAATHGDSAADPLADRPPPEDVEPEAHTIHGEADEVDSTAAEDEKT